MSLFQHILIAPSAYKGTLTAVEVADAIADGVSRASDQTIIIKAPIADGGDGTLDAIEIGVGAIRHAIKVPGADGEIADASWLELGDSAIIELACASGLGLLHGELRALDTHTIGIGQVLKHCLESGFEKIMVCVGGSASTDGGAGLLTALGARFFDHAGVELQAGGGALSRIKSCDLSALQKWHHVAISVITDVTVPLLGNNGAAHIFAPQKGASAQQVLELDCALQQFADVLEKATSVSMRDLPGAGAAGGTAFGLACALNAEIVPGFEWIAKMVQLEAKIEACDLVVTAEGALDTQSIVGKATGELAKMCRAYGRPLWAVPAVSRDDVNWSQYGLTLVENACDESGIASAYTLSRLIERLIIEHDSRRQ